MDRLRPNAMRGTHDMARGVLNVGQVGALVCALWPTATDNDIAGLWRDACDPNEGGATFEGFGVAAERHGIFAAALDLVEWEPSPEPEIDEGDPQGHPSLRKTI